MRRVGVQVHTDRNSDTKFGAGGRGVSGVVLEAREPGVGFKRRNQTYIIYKMLSYEKVSG